MNKYVLTSLLTAMALGSAQAQTQLVIGYEADATSLDPAQVTDLNTMHVLSHMYDTLVKLGPRVTFNPPWRPGGKCPKTAARTRLRCGQAPVSAMVIP